MFPEVTIEVIRQKRSGIGAAVYEGFYASTGDHVTAIGADMDNPRCMDKMSELYGDEPEIEVDDNEEEEEEDYIFDLSEKPRGLRS